MPAQTIQSDSAQYRALLKVAEAIAAHHDLPTLFRELAQRLPAVAPFDFIGLVLHDAAKNVMRVYVLETAAAQHHTTKLDGLELPMEESATGWVWTHQQPLIIPSLADETRFALGMTTLRGIGVESVCFLPLTTARRRLGAIGFGSLKPSAFSEADADFLKQVARQIAVAVESALHYEQAQKAQRELGRERDRLQLLLETNNAVATHLELRDLFKSITTSIRRVLKADVISLTLLEPEQNQLKLYALDFPGANGFIEEGTTCTLCGCPATAAITQREPVVLSRQDLDQSESTVSRRLVAEGVRSACCVPLLLRDRTLGALNVGSLKEEAFTRADADMLSEVGKQIALAVANSLAYQEIATLKDKLAKEKLYLEEEIQTGYNFEEIVGDSQALKRVLKEVQTVAATDSTVLILGETGSGKELVARALHNLSGRRERTFVKLNCAAIPTGLLESELFGHEKGAFTGAHTMKRGLWEEAADGTLFLDEITETSLSVQAKLLRALQEGVIRRVGANQEIKVTARVIAASNKDIEKAVAEGTFREDLYYRLGQVLHLPPLRQRREDIPLLVEHFIRRASTTKVITPEALDALSAYDWPGNVRQLETVIQLIIVFAGRFVFREDVARHIQTEKTREEFTKEVLLALWSTVPKVKPGEWPTINQLRNWYVQHAYHILGKQSAVAKRLGLDVRTVSTILQKEE